MNQAELIDVAAAIADGTPVDWGALEPPFSEAFALPARVVERIAQVHARIPPVETFGSSLHKSLAGVCLPGDAAAPPETPVTWGALTIVEKIGRGTFGDVYRAHDRRLNRTVALKLLRRKDDLESAVIEEGQLMARVRHPNVVTVYGAERIDARVGMWMQFVDGPTLEEEVRARGPFTPREVADAGIQLAQALDAVHRAGLLHRDVKAQNAMRDADGRVLLTDFGTGRELSESAAAGGYELAGTPLYMAPEVLNGEPASVSSDVYSLGVLLYHLATGSFPVSGRSLRDLREAHQKNRRTSARAVRSTVPKRLASVIDRATDCDPDHRYRSASDFASALTLSTRSLVARPALTGLASVLVVAAAVLAAWQWRPLPVPTQLYQVRDFVLVSRFDNTTGDPSFDGGIEYALSRELSRSDIIDVVPAERIIDALRLMKKPVETIVDRAVGREICLRDGRVKALVTGRIEKTDGGGLAITTELVDPADGAVVGSVSETAARREAVLPTIARQATRLKELFGARRGGIKGADPAVQQLSTSSFAAFQLYNEAVRLYWTEGQAEDAEPIIARAVAEDPEFAGGWLFRAFLLRNFRAPAAKAREVEARDAASRGLRLADASPDWERHFLRGAYHHSTRDYAKSLPEFDMAVRLRPDFEPAIRYLTNTNLGLGNTDAAVAGRKSVADQRPFDIAANFRAAYTILRLRESADEARPYVNRLDELLTPERSGMPQFFSAAQWRRMLPAYEAWRSGDIAGVQSIVDREAREIQQWPAERGRMQGIIAQFYMTLGRLHDAERMLVASGDLYLLSILAEIRDDVPVMRDYLLRLPPDVHVVRLVTAGLADQARARLEIEPADPVDQDLANIGRAALAVVDGNPEATIPLVRGVLARGAHFSAHYQVGCQVLATALVRVNLRAEAIAELERCAGTFPRFFGNFNTAFWMKSLIRLADEYRAAGRNQDAERIHQQLRQLLVYADPDHPIILRLKAVKGR